MKDVVKHHEQCAIVEYGRHDSLISDTISKLGAKIDQGHHFTGLV